MNPDDVEAWQRTRGIARSVVTIALDQEQLLEQSDCWRPSRPGDPPSVANVPLKVLQAFVVKVDACHRRLRTNSNSPEIENSNKSSSSESACDRNWENDQEPKDEAFEEESEVFVSSSQWPSSPVTGALPPDSSQETAQKPWNREWRNASPEDNNTPPSTKRQRRSPPVLGHDLPMSLMHTQQSESSPQCSNPSKEIVDPAARQSDHSAMFSPSSSSSSSSIVEEVRQFNSLDEKLKHQDNDTPNRRSVTYSVARIVNRSAQERSPLGAQLSQESQTASQVCIERHARSPWRIGTEYSPIDRQDQIGRNSSTDRLENCKTHRKTLKNASQMAQSKEESEFGLEKGYKLPSPMVQVNRTPDQPIHRTVASAIYPEGSLSKQSGNEASVYFSAVPSTTQKRDSLDHQSRPTNLAETAEIENVRGEVLSSPSAKSVSRAEFVPIRQDALHEQPKKRLKIRGDFAFATIYDSPEMVNRMIRQERRDFFASYATIKNQVQQADSPTLAKSTECSLLEKFKEQYPAYAGDDEHFWNMCNRINTLHAQDRMEHPSLWDDYIIRNQDEYREYLLKCAKNAEDPLSFDHFYRIEVSEPLYVKRVVTAKSLEEALVLQGKEKMVPDSDRRSLMGTPQVAEPMIAKHRKTTETTVNKHNLDINREGSQRSTGSKDHKSHRTLPWQQRAVTAIDLTENEGSNERRTPSVVMPQMPVLPGMSQRPVNQQSLASSLRAGHYPFQASDPPGPNGERESSASKGDSKDHTFAPSDTTEWWQDRHTPFKKFVRADLAIRSGKGNAFANHATNAVGEENRDRKTIREPKKWMDVLSWTLD